MRIIGFRLVFSARWGPLTLKEESLWRGGCGPERIGGRHQTKVQPGLG